MLGGCPARRAFRRTREGSRRVRTREHPGCTGDRRVSAALRMRTGSASARDESTVEFGCECTERTVLSRMDCFGIALYTVARSRLRCSACHSAHTSCTHFRCCAICRFAEEYRRACAEWRPQWVAGLGETGKPCFAEASARVCLHTYSQTSRTCKIRRESTVLCAPPHEVGFPTDSAAVAVQYSQ